MMNLSPAEVGALSYHDYHGMLWHWNDRHTPDEGPEAPPVEWTVEAQRRLEERGLVKVLH